MTVKTPYELGKELGEFLLGTCQSPQTAMALHEMDEELFDNMQFCLGLDEVTMACENCGWWENSDEMHDGLCADCQEKDGEE